MAPNSTQPAPATAPALTKPKTGPSRFRGDVPAFNPSQPVYPVYPGQPVFSQQFYYGGYYVPVYPDYQMYQYPYYPYREWDGPDGHKHVNKNGSHVRSHQSIPAPQTATPDVASVSESESAPAPDALDTLPEQASAKDWEAESPEPVSEPEPVLEPDTAHEPQQAQMPEPTVPSSKYPLCINTTLEEHASHVAEGLPRMRSRNAAKDAEVAKYPHLVNCHAVVRVFNHNTGESTLQRAPAAPPKLNWALALQAPAKRTKKAPKLAPAVAAAPKPTPPPAAKLPQPLGAVTVRLVFGDMPPAPEFTARGLTNTGNICYMNAVLQVLAHLAPVGAIFKYIEDQAVALARAPLVEALIAFLHEFRRPTVPPGRAMLPEGVYAALSKQAQFAHLQWGQQEDAEEFLGHLLDGLHEEFVQLVKALGAAQALDAAVAATLALRPQLERLLLAFFDLSDPGWAEATPRRSTKRVVMVEPLPVTRLFGGSFRSVVSRGREQSITVDPFRVVLLDVLLETVGSVEDALEHMSEQEHISFRGSDGDLGARKQTVFDALPQILVLQLKRFSYHGDDPRVEKLTKDIAYSQTLEMPLQCVLTSATYTLSGVVYHHGRTAQGGHYTCDVRTSSGWMRIDDTSVAEIEAEQVTTAPEENGKSAYILFYEAA